MRGAAHPAVDRTPESTDASATNFSALQDSLAPPGTAPAVEPQGICVRPSTARNSTKRDSDTGIGGSSSVRMTLTIAAKPSEPLSKVSWLAVGSMRNKDSDP